jgi:hypothetical protein
MDLGLARELYVGSRTTDHAAKVHPPCGRCLPLGSAPPAEEVVGAMSRQHKT